VDADDEERLLDHIKLCHGMMGQLVSIIDALWEHVKDPALKDHPNAERLENLMTMIRRATDPSREH
jgi:hypothetical protein